MRRMMTEENNNWWLNRYPWQIWLDWVVEWRENQGAGRAVELAEDLEGSASRINMSVFQIYKPKWRILYCFWSSYWHFSDIDSKTSPESRNVSTSKQIKEQGRAVELAEGLEGMSTKTPCWLELAITCAQTVQQAIVFCAQTVQEDCACTINSTRGQQPWEVLNRGEYGINQGKIGRRSKSSSKDPSVQDPMTQSDCFARRLQHDFTWPDSTKILISVQRYSK